MSRILKENEESTLPVIGMIKVGKKVETKDKNGKIIQIPKSLDYFLADGKYKHKFNEVFPDKPNLIEIMFLDDYEAFSCNERYELRVGKNRYAWGNGKVFSVYNKDNQDFDTIAVDSQEKGKVLMESIEKKTGEKFKARLTLRFAILKIKNILGVWQLNTGGEKTSIQNIVNAYDFIKKATGGRVMGLTFDLRVQKVTSDRYNTKRSYPIIELVPHATQQHLQKVSDYMVSNSQLPLILKPEVIDKLESKQIEYDDQDDYEAIDAEVAENEKSKYEIAEDMLNNCKSRKQLDEASKKIKEMNLDDQDLKDIRNIGKTIWEKLGG